VRYLILTRADRFLSSFPLSPPTSLTMPNFYSRSRTGIITPPGSGQSMYGYRNGSTQYNQTGRKSGYDAVAYVPPTAPLMYQPHTMHYSNMPSAPAPGLQQSSYGPIAAPKLPPITDRSVEHSSQSQSQRHERQPEPRRSQQPTKEKITGGVAQELDYEMDQMTDYVSDMAQSLYALLSSSICLADIDIARSVMPGAKVSPAFRKFVSGLLSSTRLPSSTILLGLNYLARRMTMLNSAPSPRKTTDGQVWRMLTIALLLGSKFLDDNTFQNRSWSEVSGIPVAELNTLEKEWLEAISWRLHVDPLTDSDFQSWLASWASWKEAKNKQRNATLERLAPLAPIDTNIQRPQPSRKTFSPASAYPSYAAESHQPSYQSQSQVRYDQAAWSQASSSHELSPPSAPDSGPNTPEWMMLPNSGLPPTEWYGYNAFYARRNQQQTLPLPYVPSQVTPHHTPFHNFYNPNPWGHNGHAAGCSCGYCARASEPYFMAPGYGQQTVVG
jgi:hypothetical protein